MIKDGCLNNVDEVFFFFQPSKIIKKKKKVYGFHNWPTHKVGYLMVKPGSVMA
jgi:hypothetical protein